MLTARYDRVNFTLKIPWSYELTALKIILKFTYESLLVKPIVYYNKTKYLNIMILWNYKSYII